MGPENHNIPQKKFKILPPQFQFYSGQESSNLRNCCFMVILFHVTFPMILSPASSEVWKILTTVVPVEAVFSLTSLQAKL